MQNELFDPRCFRIRLSEGKILINPADIIRLEARSNYTFIYFTNRKPLLIAKVLKLLHSELGHHDFIRTHRTHLVNRKYISSVNNNRSIIMIDASVASISKRMKQRVMKQLHPAA